MWLQILLNLQLAMAYIWLWFASTALLYNFDIELPCTGANQLPVPPSILL